MSEGQKVFWLGGAFVVLAAIGGATLWKIASGPDERLVRQIAELSAKVDAGAAQTAATSAKVDRAMAAVEAVRGALTAGDVGEKVERLNSGLASITAALSDLRKAPAIQSVSKQLAALDSSVRANAAALAQLGQALPAQDAAARLAPLETEIKAIDAKLADLKAAPPASGAEKQIAALDSAVGALKTSVADAAALHDKIAKDAAALHDKLGQDVAKLTGAPAPASDVVVVYLDMPGDKMPKTVATVSPLDIRFRHVGSADDAGQAEAVIPKLKEIVGGRADCTISVAGFADTLGGDKTNLTLSKKRAHVVAQKIADAFAGSKVQVAEAAWGERRLHDWTPDNTGREANRRVDIAVRCKD